MAAAAAAAPPSTPATDAQPSTPATDLLREICPDWVLTIDARDVSYVARLDFQQRRSIITHVISGLSRWKPDSGPSRIRAAQAKFIEKFLKLCDENYRKRMCGVHFTLTTGVELGAEARECLTFVALLCSVGETIVVADASRRYSDDAPPPTLLDNPTNPWRQSVRVAMAMLVSTFNNFEGTPFRRMWDLQLHTMEAKIAATTMGSVYPQALKEYKFPYLAEKDCD